MSKDFRLMQDQVKAPRKLVEAVKRGERVTPKHRADTRATHLRRFSFALLGYACAAVILIGGALLISPSIFNSEPIAGKQQENTPDPLPTELDLNGLLPTYFVPPNADGYYRSDLIWANELNPDYKNRRVFSVSYSPRAEEPLALEQCFNPNLRLPELNPSIAVELRVRVSDDENPVYNELLEAHKSEFLQRFTGWEIIDGSGVLAVPLYDLVHLDRSAGDLIAHFSKLCHEAAGENSSELIAMELTLTVAWQDYAPSAADPD